MEELDEDSKVWEASESDALGPAEKKVIESICYSHAKNGNDNRFAGVEELARGLASAFDAAVRREELYAVVQVASRLQSVLETMGLTPSSALKGSGDEYGDLRSLFDELSTPAVRN